MISKLKYYIRHLLINTKGNTLLLATATAISATFAIYFFVSITVMSREDKERVTHLYNAYQMGASVKILLDTRMSTKGVNDTSLTEADGEYRFNEAELIKYIEMESDTVFTLSDLILDSVLMDADDPTATRINSKNTSYDRENSTILVVINNIIESYDENGDAVKKVTGTLFFVNLAGQPVPDSATETNAPYTEGDPFYYLVSYEDTDAGLDANDITLKRAGVTFDGVLDKSTFDSGPQPAQVIILPGDS